MQWRPDAQYCSGIGVGCSAFARSSVSTRQTQRRSARSPDSENRGAGKAEKRQAHRRARWDMDDGSREWQAGRGGAAKHAPASGSSQQRRRIRVSPMTYPGALASTAAAAASCARKSKVPGLHPHVRSDQSACACPGSQLSRVELGRARARGDRHHPALRRSSRRPSQAPPHHVGPHVPRAAYRTGHLQVVLSAAPVHREKCSTFSARFSPPSPTRDI